MAEKRRTKRYAKRIKVEYGEKDFSTVAYTHDISKSGAFIIASKLPQPGSIVHVKFTSEEGRWFACEGEVRWAKQVPSALRQVQRGGFGVRFLLPNELVEALLPQLKTDKRFEVQYDTAETLEAAYSKELMHGALFIRTEIPMRVGSQAIVELSCPFAEKTFEIPVQVLHVIAGDEAHGTTAGVALGFVDRARVQEQLLALLPARP